HPRPAGARRGRAAPRGGAVTPLPGVFVHPKGLCESSTVGPGTRVWAFAHVLDGARVGADCNVCDHAFIESGAGLGDRVPGKNAGRGVGGGGVGADCNVCDHAFIESGAVLGDRVTVKNAVLVWDGVVVEDEVFLGPNMVFTNDLDPRVGFREEH